MRSSETVLKIQQGLIDQYNEVKDDEMSQIDDMSRSHHPDNDTMLIHENIELAPRKDTSLHLKQFNELLKNYQNDMDSLNSPPKQSSTIDLSTKPTERIEPNKYAFKCKYQCTIYLLWILLTYCVLCNSYFIYCIFFHSQNFLFFYPVTNVTSNTPTTITSITSTNYPTLYPTEIIIEPTLEPTLEPTIEPTIEIKESINNIFYIGDYKISSQIKSHAKWLLCDGKLYNISHYKQLFDIIGYIFTKKDIYYNDKTVFAVPNVKVNDMINDMSNLTMFKMGNTFIYS